MLRHAKQRRSKLAAEFLRPIPRPKGKWANALMKKWKNEALANAAQNAREDERRRATLLKSFGRREQIHLMPVISFKATNGGT